MKNRRAWIASAVVVLAASAARADLEYAIASDSVDVLGGLTFTEDSAAVNTDDGIFAFDGSAATAGEILDFIVTFSDTEDHLQIVIYTGALTNTYLGGVIFSQAGGADPSAFIVLDSTSGALVANSRNVFTFGLNAGDPLQLTTIGAFTTYNEATLTFNFDNDGDSLQIDAVANPEPGALALFALGAAGLGGLAWKKRRAARAARPVA